MALQVFRVAGPPPPNSVLLSLDGPEGDVHLDYLRCQEHFRHWNTTFAIVRDEEVLFNVFITPTSSTFYYAMNYKERQLVFVIEGRSGWLHGYYAVQCNDGCYATKGIYEFKNPSRSSRYMNHHNCTVLLFGGNHCEISGRVEQTSIGLNALRHAFETIWAYNGDNNQPESFKKAFGIIVVHTCESMKLQPVFDRICKAFKDPSVRKLAKEEGHNLIRDLITVWRKLSGHFMRAVDDTDYKIRINEFKDIICSKQDILTHLAVLFVDGYFEGKFKHDKATDPCHWERLEHGNNGVHSVDDDGKLQPYLEDNADDDDGGSDRDQQNGQSGSKQKRQGDGKGKYHGDKKGRGGGHHGDKNSRGGGRRGRVSLSAAGFPLAGGMSDGQDKELSVDQDPIELTAESHDLVCMGMLLCKPAEMSIMEESKYPCSQIIKNCSLTSLLFDTTNFQQRDLGALAMTLGGDMLSTTEAGTPLSGLEEWYLIGWV